jgi:hypothetical protein
LVLQGSRDDVVAQVEDKEADDKQWTHTGPHGLPVPVEGAASHGLKVTFKSIWTMAGESQDYSCFWRQGGVQFCIPS